MYVDTVVGTDTVNTMPPATLDALLDHGNVVADTIHQDLPGARATMEALANAKISLYDVTRRSCKSTASRRSPIVRAMLHAIVYKQKLHRMPSGTGA